MKTMTLAALAGLILTAACADRPFGVGKRARQPFLSSTEGAQRVSAMTQNLYVGADVDAVIGALMSPDPSDDAEALLTAIRTLQLTDFPTRAGAIADEVALYRPDVIALQEVSDIHIDLSGFGSPVVIDLQFLPIIQAQLAARGLQYSVAATVENIDAQPFPGIELVDYDAVLVADDRVTVDSWYAQTFSNNLGVIAPGVELKRGFAGVTVSIDGNQYDFVSTHLEPDLGGLDLTALRAAQASELAAVLSGRNAVVMGDLNDPPGSLMYQVFRQAGFRDVWAELRPDVDGFTNAAVHPADLSNTEAGFTQRVDYVWARGTGHPEAGLLGQITLVGNLPNDRVDGPEFKIWPSDHAGLVAELLTPPAEGLTP